MDRKARIREYKETARPMGVFRVRNTATGKSFIGSSNDLPAMLNRQRFQLDAGSHPNSQLQSDWKELGAAVFEFDTLDTLQAPETPGADVSEDLRTLEEMWMQNILGSGGSLYNVLAKKRG
jgi:hypothetical protein